jgi:hypothetical protein
MLTIHSPVDLDGSFTCLPCRDSRLPIVTRPQHLSPSPSIKSELFVHLFWPKSNPCHSYKLLGGGGAHTKSSYFTHSSALSFLSFPAIQHFNPSDLQPSSSFSTDHGPCAKSRSAITYKMAFPQVLSRLHIRFARQPKPLRAITYENTGGRRYACRICTSFNLRHLVFSGSRTFDIPTFKLIGHRTNGHTAPFVSEWLARACASLNRSFAEFLRRDRSCAA